MNTRVLATGFANKRNIRHFFVGNVIFLWNSTRNQQFSFGAVKRAQSSEMLSKIKVNGLIGPRNSSRLLRYLWMVTRCFYLSLFSTGLEFDQFRLIEKSSSIFPTKKKNTGHSWVLEINPPVNRKWLTSSLLISRYLKVVKCYTAPSNVYFLLFF